MKLRVLMESPECAEQKGSQVFDDRMVRVESVTGGDLLVYAVNRDRWSADAWIAYPDARGGQDFYVMAYAPATYSTQFSVLALSNGTTVSLTYTGLAEPQLPGENFVLQAGESLQIQSNGDLTGTRIQSDKPIHAWSGNIRALVVEVIDPDRPNIRSGSRDHLVEQLVPVETWGFEYNIQPVPARVYGDHIKVVAAEDDTLVTVEQGTPTGVITNLTFTLNAGGFDKFDAYAPNAYRVTSTKKIMVAQVSKSKDFSETRNDPSLLIVPPIQQYTNRYLFSTPKFSGGEGNSRPYNFTIVLLSALEDEKDGIIIRNGDTEFRVSDQTIYGDWIKVPGSNYYNKAAAIEYGTNVVLHPEREAQFMCLFYGSDDRESLGFPVGMRLGVLSQPRRT